MVQYPCNIRATNVQHSYKLLIMSLWVRCRGSIYFTLFRPNSASSSGVLVAQANSEVVLDMEGRSNALRSRTIDTFCFAIFAISATALEMRRKYCRYQSSGRIS